MYRIRFHGRGGQGIKTASRILGSAFFLGGYEVQDAPLYGAERRGAPIFATVRADHRPITERGPIRDPDLVAVADDTLIGVPAAGVLSGLSPRTVLLIEGSQAVDEWARRLNIENRILVLPRPPSELGSQFVGAACAGAACALTGVIARDTLERAVGEEFGPAGPEIVATNLRVVLGAFDRMVASGVRITMPKDAVRPADRGEVGWIELPREGADVSAPAIHGEVTSVEVRTGLWRTMRPVIDHERCRRCWWVCSTFCPDDAISVSGDGEPIIDYDHCKGCMICVAQCPPHAIEAIPESTARIADADPGRPGASRNE